MPILQHLVLIQTIAKATDQTLNTLRQLATQFRAAHLFSHKAHVNVDGDSFIANHEWLGEIYPQFDGYWDALTERIKGLGGAAMIDKVNSDAAKMSEALGEGDNNFYFRTILQMISQAVFEINAAAKEPTMDEGVRDLIVGISSELQVLQYKIQQRLGGDVAKCDQAGLSLRHPGLPEKTPTYAADQKADAGQDVEYPNNLQKAGKSMMTTICKEKDAKGHGSNKHGGATATGGGQTAQQMYDAASPFAQAYVRAALWLSNDESDDAGGDLMDKNYGPQHFHPDAMKKMVQDADAFEKEHGDKFKGNEARAGHDFWLNRNGHGSGFWDDNEEHYTPENAEALDSASKKAGDVNLYIGDDKKIHEDHEHLAKTVTFAKSFKQLGAFAANISKAGKGWYHGNQVEAGSTSVRADKYASLMKQSKAAAKNGSALQAKAAEYEAMNHWKKMAPGERGHAMQLLNDSASEDIGKSQDRGFEFGHGRAARR